ncbi:MAG: efflux RND transporter periplasmic adaptor subunit [Deltaproteobacteria bacterium]|nr:efflux RND transporter periplasmic adaptor subunit [Deltaproteobacteria bacterium]
MALRRGTSPGPVRRLNRFAAIAAFEPGPIATASTGRIERIVVATGTVEPEREVLLRPRIAGIIEKIHVEDGDDVKAGQPLIEIERELLASQAREAEAAVREAKVDQTYAKIEIDRANELRAGGAASLKTNAARYERSRAAVARARARYDTLATQLSYATIAATLDGRILDVVVEEGSAVSPVTSVTGGTLLLSMAGTETLRLEGKVDENEIVRVAIGQPARIRTEAFGDRSFSGRVAKIAPLGQRIQNVTYFEVEIEITDADAALLRPRMSGDAEIVVEVSEAALTIPESALRYLGEQIYVEVLYADGTPGFETRDITIGIVDGAKVQVLSGLSEGEEVRLH